MAAFAFEFMDQTDAAAFGADDTLVFITDGATANAVTVAPFSNGSSGSLGNSGITLTFAGKSLTFGTSISDASLDDRIIFNDDSHLLIGTQTGETITSVVEGDSTSPQTVFALGGDDTIDFSGVTAGSANYLHGGFGADTIDGGDGNNHIYGNVLGATPGAVDPSGRVPDAGDTITVGAGTNYIQGNSGNDTITIGVNGTDPVPGDPDGDIPGTPGTAASTGNNRVFGGADDDSITVQGAGLNSVNGNMGNDIIDASTSTGSNTLRGGQGDDQIFAGRGYDTVMGDIGNDTLVVVGSDGPAVAGTPNNFHITTLTGGQGSDTFDFSQAGAGVASTFNGTSSSGATAGTTFYQTITDFTVGEDRISLAVNPEGQTTEVGTSATVFANVRDAEIFAQTQLNGNDTNFVVSSLSVGTQNNTYLFYNDANGGDPTSGNSAGEGLGIIHLVGVNSTSITNNSFQDSTIAG